MHAAHEAGAKLGAPEGCYLICISVKDEPMLLDLASYLASKNIGSVVFTEPDLGGQSTALAALVPYSEGKLFSRFPSWRLSCPTPN